MLNDTHMRIVSTACEKVIATTPFSTVFVATTPSSHELVVNSTRSAATPEARPGPAIVNSVSIPRNAIAGVTDVTSAVPTAIVTPEASSSSPFFTSTVRTSPIVAASVIVTDMSSTGTITHCSAASQSTSVASVRSIELRILSDVSTSRYTVRASTSSRCTFSTNLSWLRISPLK